MAKNEVAKIETGAFAIAVMPETEMVALISANMGEGSGVTMFDLDRVKMPGGGGLAFEVPTLEGDVDYHKSIEGVVLGYKYVRAYWPESYEESGGAPPACSSQDSVFGEGEPGGKCSTCPYAKFGSGMKDGKPTRGQACQARCVCLVLRPDDILPIIVSVPPTSLKAIRQYFLRLAGHRKRFDQVVTKFTLVGDKNQDGTKFSRVTFSVDRFLSDDEAKAVSAYSEQIRSFTTSQVSPEDFS